MVLGRGSCAAKRRFREGFTAGGDPPESGRSLTVSPQPWLGPAAPGQPGGAEAFRQLPRGEPGSGAPVPLSPSGRAGKAEGSAFPELFLNTVNQTIGRLLNHRIFIVLCMVIALDEIVFG